MALRAWYTRWGSSLHYTATRPTVLKQPRMRISPFPYAPFCLETMQVTNLAPRWNVLGSGRWYDRSPEIDSRLGTPLRRKAIWSLFFLGIHSALLDPITVRN